MAVLERIAIEKFVLRDKLAGYSGFEVESAETRNTDGGVIGLEAQFGIADATGFGVARQVSPESPASPDQDARVDIAKGHIAAFDKLRRKFTWHIGLGKAPVIGKIKSCVY